MATGTKRGKFVAWGIVLLAVVLAGIGFTIWYAYHSSQVADDALKSANKVSNDIPKLPQVKTFADCQKAPGSKMLMTFPAECVTASGKTFAGQSQAKGYTSATEKATFSYPFNWKVVKAVVDPNDNNADSIGLTSPDGKVTVSWVSSIGGVGGACDDTIPLDVAAGVGPSGLGACPSSVVVDATAIPGAPEFYVTEGYITPDNKKFYPWLAVTDKNGTTSRREMGYELFAGRNNGKQNALFSIGAINKMTGAPSFTSAAQAKDFLATADVVAAKQILLSLRY